MGSTFSERLKNYRRAKNLTQQELADLLGVSNKTISRWESGGYPDLGMLVPLARALGVTADDLLDGEKPLRTLTQADWQNFLSFAFALGGGVLFFLLDLFMPMVLCYLAYLACMAYGIYLQRHYCYRTRWFRAGNAVMNLSVNLTVAFRCVVPAQALLQMIPAAASWDYHTGLLLPLCYCVGSLLALAATVLTLRLTEQEELSPPTWDSLKHWRFRLRRPALRELAPSLCALLLPLFWLPFRSETLPLATLQQQSTYYRIFSAALVALCALLFLRKYRRGLLSSAILLIGSSRLPDFALEMVYRKDIQEFVGASQIYVNQARRYPDQYILFSTFSPELLIAAAVLALLCLLPLLVGLRKTPAPTEEET